MEINKILNDYTNYSEEELKLLRYYIIEHESELRLNYPIVPYDIYEDKIMIIADTHLCHKDDNMDYIYWAYNMAKEENISKVFIAGDIFEGIITATVEDIKINEIKKNYNSNYYNYVLSLARSMPNIDGIDTKILLGNHDLSMLYYPDVTPKDVMDIYDNIPNSELLGIGKVYINWNSISTKSNCRFILNHDTNLKFIDHNYIKEKLIISGHHHYYKYDEKEIYLSSLSNNRTFEPGLIIMELNNNILTIKPIKKIPLLNVTAHERQKTLQL